ncbi:DUF4332 domain-containing protein [Synechococcus sp. CS-1328]|nr:DUF4332 domain-containing protein [Synechococcus sp. CS-1328]
MVRSCWRADRLLPLPRHFHREQRRLEQAGIVAWDQLAGLEDRALRDLGSGGGASERQLIKLRAQARLVCEVGLHPSEAALLLYAGIADRRGLAQADPQRLWVQMGRLQRSLTGMAVPALELSTLRQWIAAAQAGPGRSRN